MPSGLFVVLTSIVKVLAKSNLVWNWLLVSFQNRRFSSENDLEVFSKSGQDMVQKYCLVHIPFKTNPHYGCVSGDYTEMLSESNRIVVVLLFLYYRLAYCFRV